MKMNENQGKGERQGKELKYENEKVDEKRRLILGEE